LLSDAVYIITSKYLATYCKKLSTPGRFKTYMFDVRPSISTGIT